MLALLFVSLLLLEQFSIRCSVRSSVLRAWFLVRPRFCGPWCACHVGPRTNGPRTDLELRTKDQGLRATPKGKTL
jgi:hypothetical protein